MSTVVDNDKYIINGSTLSEIGDAIRGQMPKYEAVTEDVVCYVCSSTTAWSSDVEVLNLTEEKIQEWYKNTLPSPITAVKIICTSDVRYDSDRAYVKVNDNKKYFTKNESYTYSLPITIYGSGASYSSNGYDFKIYPLNGDNHLSWDSNYYYPSDYYNQVNHLYKEEVSYARLRPKTCLVSEIAQRIASLPSLSGAQIDFIKIRSKEMGSSSEGTNLLTTIGIKDISDIYYIIGYNDCNSKLPVGLVYLDMVNNPNPVSTGIYAN